MANLDKQNESLLKMSNEEIDKLEEKLSVVYDSLVSVNAMVNHSIENLESMHNALLEISNVNFTNSSLNISLEGLLQNMDNLVKSAGCAKIELLEISKLYASTYGSISSVSDSSKMQENIQTESASDGFDIVDIMNFINGELAGIIFGELVEKLLKNIPSAGALGGTVKTGGKGLLLNLLAGIEEVIKWISPIIDMVSYFGEKLSGFIKGLVKVLKVLPKGKLLLATIAAYIAGYYGWRRGEELEDLRKNIEELGEEEGRVAAGTGFMDRQALFQYDKQQADMAVLEAWWFGDDSILGDDSLLDDGASSWKSSSGNMLGGKMVATMSQPLFLEETFAIVSSGIVGGLSIAWEEFVEFWEDAGLYKWWTEDVAPFFSLETWLEMGTNIKTALSTMWDEFVEWWKTTGLYIWWTEDIAPFFSLETWLEMGTNIKTALSTMWDEFVEWWKTTGLYIWWTEDIAPFFSLETWLEMGTNIKTALSTMWDEFVKWWKTTGLYKWWTENVEPFFTEENWTFSGIKAGLKKAWDLAVESIKTVWNTFADWLNERLTFKFEGCTLSDGTIIEPFEVNLGKIPVFEVGGFPEDGLFMANHGELVGKFINGKTAVANNEQIVSGIKLGVRDAVTEVLAPYLVDIVRNTRETADKEFTTYIGDKEIARASERGRRAMGLQLITES